MAVVPGLSLSTGTRTARYAVIVSGRIILYIRYISAADTADSADTAHTAEAAAAATTARQ